MSVFAKLFEDVLGGQVLYTMDETDDGEASITARTDHDDIAVVVKMTGWRGDEGFDKRDQAFAGITREQAENLRRDIIEKVMAATAGAAP